MTKEHDGAQYNELLFDDTQGEVRAKLSSEHGKTQLNQGWLTHPRRDGEAEPRGEGFELRTDRSGALRAARGLLLSTEARHDAQGKQLDRGQAQSVLDSARKVADDLSQAADQQGVHALEIGPETLDVEGKKVSEAGIGHIYHFTEAVRSLEAGTNTDPECKTAADNQTGQQAVLLASGVEGVGLASMQELILASGMNLDTIGLRDTQQTTGRRWVHNVGEKISLFVRGDEDKANLLLTTAKGHAKLQAQSGDVDVTGEQNLNLFANKKKATLFAGEELLLNCGGSYLRLKGGNTEIHNPGKVSIKAASLSVSGPDSLDVKTQDFGKSNLCSGQDAAETEGGAVIAIASAVFASGDSGNNSADTADNTSQEDTATETAESTSDTFSESTSDTAQEPASGLGGISSAASSVSAVIAGVTGIGAAAAAIVGSFDIAQVAGLVSAGGLGLSVLTGGVSALADKAKEAESTAAGNAVSAASSAIENISGGGGQGNLA
jgi:type VI secretion system secreted protein VgrG